jgi:hypothetical protein
MPGEREEFLVALKRILPNNAHAILAADEIEFVPTDNPALASVTAICDKIIARGNPTLVDLDFDLESIFSSCPRDPLSWRFTRLSSPRRPKPI